jgi:hypothetical protein
MDKLHIKDIRAYEVMIAIYDKILSAPLDTLHIYLINLKQEFIRAIEIYDTYSKYMSSMDEPIKKFSLEHFSTITSEWDTKLVLDMYRRNEVDIDYLTQCFYYNAGVGKIQAINNVGGVNVIQTIEGNEDLIPKLDLYHGIFTVDTKPSYIARGIQYLILEDICQTPLDHIIHYIKKSTSIVSLGDIREEYSRIVSPYCATQYGEMGARHLGSKDSNITTIIADLNQKCLDISYNNRKAYEIVTLEPGSLLRCSVKSNTSYTIGYMYFMDTIPETIRVPKILSKYCRKD